MRTRARSGGVAARVVGVALVGLVELVARDVLEVVVVGAGLVGGMGRVVAVLVAEPPEHAVTTSAPTRNHERRTRSGYGPSPVRCAR